MSRQVFCRKYQAQLEGLAMPPVPGPLGADLFANVSRRAWEEWLALQTMLINEKHLSMADPAARKYLATQRERFLNNEAVDKAEGYVPPNS